MEIILRAMLMGANDFTACESRQSMTMQKACKKYTTDDKNLKSTLQLS